MLLKLLQIIFFVQALYITFLLLMFRKYGANLWGGFGLFFMWLWPVLITCVIFPLTLPVLVLVLELVGHIGFAQLAEIRERQGQSARKHREECLVPSDEHDVKALTSTTRTIRTENPLYATGLLSRSGHSATRAAETSVAQPDNVFHL